MQKIVIIGPCAAGKTTLAKLLGQILGIPILHLDSIFWHTSWKPLTTAERRARLQQFINAHEAWIVEGSYPLSSQPALESADTIIHLDAPILTRLYRLIKRCMLPCGDDVPARCRRWPSRRLLMRVLFSGRWQCELEGILTPHAEKLWRVQAHEIKAIVEAMRGT